MKKKKFGSLEVWRFGVMLIALSSILYPLSVLSAVPLSWDVDVTRVAPVTFDAYHGETLALEAVLKDASRPLDLTGKTARLYWQTNGMESVYWATNATVSATNHIAATFTGAMDPGAASVRGFLGIAGENYRASFVIRFRPSPGYVPGLIDRSPRVLDFRQTVVINPPWPTDETIDTRIRNVIRDDHITAICPTNTVKGIISNTVTKAFVEDLGISGGGGSGCNTNAVIGIINEAVRTNYLCTVAAAQTKADAAQSAAKQDAAAKYLPLDGSGTMSGVIRFSSGCRIDTTDDSGGYIILEAKNIRAMTGPEDSSDLTADGTPVLTEGLAKSTFPIVTNAYTKAEADGKFLPILGNAERAKCLKDVTGKYVVIPKGSENRPQFVDESGAVAEFYDLAFTSEIPSAEEITNAAIAQIDHTLPRFSNEVLAVGLNVDTNLVAALNAMSGGSISTETGATTVGALLAALAAAVAWLKKNKLTKGMTAGVPDDPNVSALFSSANTSNNAENVRTSAADATPIKTYIDNTVGNVETLLSAI